MTIRAIYNWLPISAVLLLVATGCGGAVDQGTHATTAEDGVRAMNLDTGETQPFSSAKDIPAGWASCSDPGCAEGVPPSVPCQNLGTDLCEQQPECRLEVYAGMGTVTVCGDSDPSCIPTEYDDEVEYGCIPKLPPRCSELPDEESCSARDDCTWTQVGVRACPQGESCSPRFGCQTDRSFSRPCESLYKRLCVERHDCQWKPTPCPPCDPADDACSCPAYCQAADPQCAPFTGPFPGVCPDGIQLLNDNNGCLIGVECVVEPVVDRCAGKACGDDCTPPGMGALLTCNAAGQCVGGQVYCEPLDCAGMACGDDCSPPGTSLLYVCNPDGQCVSAIDNGESFACP